MRVFKKKKKIHSLSAEVFSERVYLSQREVRNQLKPPSEQRAQVGKKKTAAE